MRTDSINDEILRIKRELAGRFGNDLDSIIADAILRERNAISLPPRRCQTDAPKPPIKAVVNGTSSPATY
jgi:hypothetical protein